MQDSWVTGELLRARINGFGKCQEKKVCLFTSAYRWLHFLQLLLSQRISQEFHFHSTEGEVSCGSSICWLLSQLCFQMPSWDKDTEKNKSLYHSDWTRARGTLVVLMKRFLQWPSVFVACKGNLEQGLFNSCGCWKPRECPEAVQGPEMSGRSGLIQCGKSLLDLLRRKDVDLGCKFEHYFSAVS